MITTKASPEGRVVNRAITNYGSKIWLKSKYAQGSHTHYKRPFLFILEVKHGIAILIENYTAYLWFISSPKNFL